MDKFFDALYFDSYLLPYREIRRLYTLYPYGQDYSRHMNILLIPGYVPGRFDHAIHLPGRNRPLDHPPKTEAPT